MYQITALYQGAEIGYGEGESKAYAMEECKDSVPQMYYPVRDEITFSVRKS